jgi:hypothetical protein
MFGAWMCRHSFADIAYRTFFMVTVFCFTKSSEKPHDWFIGTNMYKRNLQSFLEKRGMLMRTKLSIICTVTLLMGFGFFMMIRKNIMIPCIILALVWVCHLIYSVFGVKTIRDENSH